MFDSLGLTRGTERTVYPRRRQECGVTPPWESRTTLTFVGPSFSQSSLWSIPVPACLLVLSLSPLVHLHLAGQALTDALLLSPAYFQVTARENYIRYPRDV